MQNRPLAVRGSVLMLPVQVDTQAIRGAREAGNTIQITLEDGRTLPGHLAVIERRPDLRHRHWTADARGMRAVLLAEQLDAVEEAGSDGRSSERSAFALVELPHDADGDLWIGEQRIEPVWRDLPDVDTTDAGVRTGQDPDATADTLDHADPSDPIASLRFAIDHDLPDPDNPFEYWRWVLIAERLDVEPPTPDRYGDAGNLIARHYADLWRVGLARIESHNPELAERIRQSATRTCRDDGRPFAGWNPDPGVWSDALEPMLSVTMPIDEATERLERWCDAQSQPLIWIEQQSGDDVHIVLVNRGDDRMPVHAYWIDAATARRRPPAREAEVSRSPARSADVAPGQLRRLAVERPEPPEPIAVGMPPPTEPSFLQLRIDAGERSAVFDVGERYTVVKPPGLALFPFQPAATLGWLHGGVAPDTPSSRTTTAIVRRIRDQWEVFIECYRPDPGDVEPASLDELSRIEHLPGHEAITLFIGDSGADSADHWRDAENRIVLTVPMRGDARTWRGSTSDIRIERRIYADRWLCRIALPERLLVREDGLFAGIGLVRTHSGRLSFESAPGIAVPWRIDPGLRFGDFSQWDD